jgi:hypothetical protein
LVGYGKKAFHKPPQALARKRCEQLRARALINIRKNFLDFLIFGKRNIHFSRQAFGYEIAENFIFKASA